MSLADNTDPAGPEENGVGRPPELLREGDSCNKGGVELRLHEAVLALILLIFTQMTSCLDIVGASG